MKHNIFKCLLLGIGLTLTFASCREDAFDDDGRELGDNGKTMISIAEGPSKDFVFDAFTDIKPISGFTVKRDVNSNATLSTSSSVELVKAAVPAGYTFLPDNLFTLQTASAAKFTKTATGYTANFAPGDFALNFDINLNGALLDPALKYAMAFTIGAAGGGTVTAGPQKSISVIFTVKNKYDGIWEVENLNWNYTLNAAFAPGTPRTRHLVTRSGTESVLFDPGLAANYGVYFLNAGSPTYFGNFSPVFKFDPATDKVIGVSNYYPVPNSSNRDAKLDPTGVNQVTISGNSKVMDVSYNMVTSGATVLFLREKWTYIGKRP